MEKHIFPPLTIKKAEVFVFRAPIETPVRTSFGIMYDRPAVLVRLEDSDGTYGWGEVWCNFPACGAEHRGRLLETVLLSLILGKTFESPEDAIHLLTTKSHVLRLQTDEPGPIAQSIAGLDIALWDMFARRAGKPLYSVLGGEEKAFVPAYASGINPVDTLKIVERCRDEGFTAFKFKIGFDAARDMRNIEDVSANLQKGEGFAIDVNQAWDLPFALEFTSRLRDYSILWLEEPLPCDTHCSQWKILAAHCQVPLAAGENFRSEETYREAFADPWLGVIQPDICKWGGLSRTLPIAKAILKAGIRYCPHYLGGGIGLLASAHLLAAVGGDGTLEVDINPNPLRPLLADPYPQVKAGNFSLPSAPGLGVIPQLGEITSLRTFYKELST
ncbi:MAG: mandelate racemase/muconate lactonizing enzyme family protein [Desulfovibrio sp.]|nr:mandelate racemase/muconate lactonizing enzyme family protein [Desulfovibrio sp.]